MSPRLACFQLTALSKTTLFQLVYLLKFFIVILSHFWMQWPNFTYCFLLLFQIFVSTVSANAVWFVISRKLIVVEMYSIHHYFLILCLQYIDIYKERSLWIIITIFFIFIVLILTWTLNVKRNRCVFEPETFSVWTKILFFLYWLYFI